MAYRDECEAARMRVEGARELVLSQAQRLLPVLVARLPAELQERLERCRALALEEGHDLPSWRDVERGVAQYQEVLAEVMQRVPEIDQRSPSPTRLAEPCFRGTSPHSSSAWR